MNSMSIVSSSFIGAEKKTLPFWGHFLVSEILGRSGFILFKNVLMQSRQFTSIILHNNNRLFCASHYSTFQTTSITVLDVFLSLHRKPFDLTF